MKKFNLWLSGANFSFGLVDLCRGEYRYAAISFFVSLLAGVFGAE
jgi:hypothetical protein